MNPVISKTFTYLMLANGFAFSGWVIRNYLINWWVLEKTNSTTIVGLVAASPTITVLLTAPLGGQLADKYSRKKLFLPKPLKFSSLCKCNEFFCYLNP